MVGCGLKQTEAEAFFFLCFLCCCGWLKGIVDAWFMAYMIIEMSKDDEGDEN